MGKIAIRHIVSGMVVDNDVEDKNGRVLLPKGSLIEEKHLRIFKMWGIFEIDILENGSPGSIVSEKGVTPHRLNEVMRIIGPRYAKSNLDNLCVKEIFKQDALLRIESQNEITKKDSGIIFPEKDLEEIDYESCFKDYISPKDLVRGDIELFTLPDIFEKLTFVINDHKSSARDISQIVENDTALSARTLKLINSSFYGFLEKIDSIYQAVSLLGTRQLSLLAMGLSVIKIFNELPSVCLDMNRFWRHCLGVGLCGKIISKHLELEEPDRIFVAGILHDIGRLVMIKNIPMQTALTIRYAWDNNIFLSDSEEHFLGFNHSDVGREICSLWRLPSMFTDVVANHHSPENSKYPEECSVVHLSEIIVNAIGIGCSGEKMVLPLSDFAWDTLGISENIIPVVIRQLNTEIETIIELIS